MVAPGYRPDTVSCEGRRGLQLFIRSSPASPRRVALLCNLLSRTRSRVPAERLRMRHMRKLYLGLAGLLTLLLMQAVPASADPAALPNDVVGVGSDTTFVALDFLADGDNRA